MTQDAKTADRSLRRRLGRGLGSLISTPVEVAPPSGKVERTPSTAGLAAEIESPGESDQLRGGGGIQMLDPALIERNPKQPRQTFDEASIAALAESIKTSGLMQPIVVRPKQSKDRFLLIAGERRWRAAQLAGLKLIPAIVRDVDERTAAELALVENLQREDLNAMDRAEAFQRLIDDFGLTHQEIAQRVGLDRTSISNHLRLQELDAATKEAIRNALLSLGHAKALLSITNISRRSAVAMQAIKEQWSVRETERRARDAAGESTATRSEKAPVASPSSANMADLARKLGEHLGTKVQLQSGRTKGAGRLIIEFYSIDQFEGLMRRIEFEAD